MIFRDRSDAGKYLAEKLQKYKGRADVLVLALPRGARGGRLAALGRRAFLLRRYVLRRVHVPDRLADAWPDLSLAANAHHRRASRGRDRAGRAAAASGPDAPHRAVGHGPEKRVPVFRKRPCPNEKSQPLAWARIPPINRRDFSNRLPRMAQSNVKKVVLAYSGGLDTPIILKWLQTTYRREVVTFTADLRQGEELEPARKKAELLGIKPENIFIEDLREEFVRDYVFPMFRANTVYEGQYLLGTSIARPLIGKKQIEIAERVGADAVAHGATGKGNDQVRFELTYYALKPDVTVIAPWREWDLTSRTKLIEFAEKNQIPIAKDKRGDAPFSVDANLLTRLNELGKVNGIGRLDLVENRFVGMKSRGMYETPGGTILLAAHRGIEQITLDRGAAHLKDELMPKYAELIYNGFWFSPEREMLQAAIDRSQEFVAGRVRLKLYRGSVAVIGRESPYSLYDQDLVTFEEGAVAYDHRDAAGFIRLNALRLRTLGQRKKKLKL